MTIIPTYNLLLVPSADVHLRKKMYKDVTGRDPEVDERVTMIVARKEVRRAEFTSESFYPVGLYGTITEVNPGGYLTIRTANRVDIESVGVTHDGK